MTVPSISVVIPVYNRPDMIAECLASLAPSLEALHEVIVVDDGSTDGATPAAARTAIAALGDDRVRLVEQTNAGPGAARNTGAAEATGDWLAFLDSDDLWLPWTGRALCDALERHPDIVSVFLNVRKFADGAELQDWKDPETEDILCDNFFELARMRPMPVRIGAGYFAIRRSVFQESGGFVPNLRGSEDNDFYFRVAGEGQYLGLKHPITVGVRTSNTDSLTQNMPDVYEGLGFLLDGYASGRYQDPFPNAVEEALGDLLGFWIHELFWWGYGREGYDILLKRGAFGILMRTGQRVTALKLLFIPALAAIRPKNHRFRWRPASP